MSYFWYFSHSDYHKNNNDSLDKFYDINWGVCRALAFVT